ncbi:MAG: helix-hairpin-helix domain-containing protein [Bacteroidales bacterium]|nr:helix-hairpin-helix domain-containing protein [Bacteroidales bacterium]
MKRLLSLSSQERKGVMLLIILIVLVTAVNVWLKTHSPKETGAEATRLHNELAAFEQQLTLRNDSQSDNFKSGRFEIDEVNELFPFDPNQVTADEMRKLGIHNRLISTWINYRLHGGRFYEKDDLKKVYGLTDDHYKRLLPYIVITGAPDADAKPAPVKFRAPAPVDLNLADANALEELPGIGPVLSNRIIRYRSLLGGFYNINQLSEVYGLTDSVVVLLQNRVLADTSSLVKLNLNEAREYELARHPYIGKYSARGIISYRSQVNRINDAAELKKNGLISEETFEKLKRYLEL